MDSRLTNAQVFNQKHPVPQIASQVPLTEDGQVASMAQTVHRKRTISKVIRAQADVQCQIGKPLFYTRKQAHYTLTDDFLP